jgi:hypothetical protein
MSGYNYIDLDYTYSDPRTGLLQYFSHLSFTLRAKSPKNRLKAYA